MNTVVENWIGHEDITVEPENSVQIGNQVVGEHSTNSSRIFSIVNSSMFHLRSRANGLVSDIFRHFQTADSDDTVQLEQERNDVFERLKREIERVSIESNP